MSVAVVPTKTELIESKIDKSAAGSMTIGNGGVQFNNMGELMEFAKVMAIAGQAIPPHMRNQVGFCLAVCLQSIEWRMSPIAVANKSYVVNDRICYESQLIHAVIEQRAPIKGRLRHEFIGEGEKRQCRVWATDRNETEPFSYTSPCIFSINPKNSPLWKSKPDLQLFYNTSRDWARIYYPDVIMGVYSDDEIQQIEVEKSDSAKRITKLDDLTDRLTRSEPSNQSDQDATEQLKQPEGETVNTATPSENAKAMLDEFTKGLPDKTEVNGVKEFCTEFRAAVAASNWSDDLKAATDDQLRQLGDERIATIRSTRGGKS